MKYFFLNQPSILMATHSKPNVGIWQFPLFFSLAFGDGKLPNSLHFLFYFLAKFHPKNQLVMIG
jgi:hypothetical protein